LDANSASSVPVDSDVGWIMAMANHVIANAAWDEVDEASFWRGITFASN
jgi:hypothetical protein